MPQNSATHTSLTVTSTQQEKRVAPATSETKSSQAEDNKKIMRKLVIVFILAAIFMGIEIGGGILAGSIAILSDAAHMLSDLLGFVISIVSVYISGFKASKKHSYGFHRAGVIGALASVLVIWILSGFLIYFAIIRIINIDKVDVEGPLMFGIACFGLLTNLVMVKVLHSGHHHHGHSHDHGHGGHSHSHGHNHSHGHTHKKKSKKEHKHNHNHSSEKECIDKHEEVKELEMQPTTHKHSENCDHEHQENEHHHAHESHSHSHNHDHKHEHEHKKDKEQNKIENQENIITLSKETDHHHHQNCDHKEEIAPKNLSAPADKDNLNIRATVIHILGDILQSIGVIIASILIWISPDKLKIVDPILTFIFAIIVLCTTLRVARDCIFVLMEGTPMELDHEDFEEKLKKVEGVSGLHDLHVWSLGVGKPAMSAHIYTNSDLASVLKKTTEVCRSFGISHTTIQIETTTDEENENFVNCQHNIH